MTDLGELSLHIRELKHDPVHIGPWLLPAGSCPELLPRLLSMTDYELEV